ncbi:hypothetical protein PENANT_c001G04451 [Penicillium antarcticum]|uniref:Uncharacterized protein n=1 Tax=Penicillium antarcticum TaxID=416450 RepID=A0A1V6QNX2_9EURO|nr:hypothetical protein PENANT_c001G04451 [Penicillium antarcticum]
MSYGLCEDEAPSSRRCYQGSTSAALGLEAKDSDKTPIQPAPVEKRGLLGVAQYLSTIQ